MEPRVRTSSPSHGSPSCGKLDGVATWLINGFVTAFFGSLERCSCIRIATAEDDGDEGNDIPLIPNDGNLRQEGTAEGEIVEFHRPEPGFTSAEIQELWSLLEDPARSNSGSQDSFQAISLIDEERRRKRMISNRESARRSRLRKKRHLENLAIQTDRLKMKNQELKRQLNLVVNRCYMVRRQNEGLWSEFVALHARLSDLYRISVPMQEKENSCMQISFNHFS
ncbi:hypothetical protein Csa_012642 [Cucumis sativus]|nr:hypothetical protein Csa_012642 [Cucumis sativus]